MEKTRIIKDERGSAILWAAITIAFLTILAAMLLSVSTTRYTRSTETAAEKQAYISARSAAELIVAQITAVEPELPENLVSEFIPEVVDDVYHIYDIFGGDDTLSYMGKCDVSITRVTDYDIRVKATAVVNEATRTVAVNLKIQEDKGMQGKAGKVEGFAGMRINRVTVTNYQTDATITNRIFAQNGSADKSNFITEAPSNAGDLYIRSYVTKEKIGYGYPKNVTGVLYAWDNFEVVSPSIGAFTYNVNYVGGIISNGNVTLKLSNTQQSIVGGIYTTGDVVLSGKIRVEGDIVARSIKVEGSNVYVTGDISVVKTTSDNQEVDGFIGGGAVRNIIDEIEDKMYTVIDPEIDVPVGTPYDVIHTSGEFTVAREGNGYYRFDGINSIETNLKFIIADPVVDEPDEPIDGLGLGGGIVPLETTEPSEPETSDEPDTPAHDPYQYDIYIRVPADSIMRLENLEVVYSDGVTPVEKPCVVIILEGNAEIELLYGFEYPIYLYGQSGTKVRLVNSEMTATTYADPVVITGAVYIDKLECDTFNLKVNFVEYINETGEGLVPELLYTDGEPDIERTGIVYWDVSDYETIYGDTLVEDEENPDDYIDPDL